MNDIFNFQKDVVAITDKGKVRPKNEDSKGYVESPNGHIFIVCDGMGGHVGGQVASQLAVKSIVEYFAKPKSIPIQEAMVSAIRFANHQIFEKAKAEPALRGMGTTVTLLVIQADKIYIAHVGDSRIYIHSDGKLHRITKDHSFVQSLVDRKEITDEQAESHPRKNELMRALGIKPDVTPEVAPQPIIAKNGDIFLMCSDGLNGMVNDMTMEKTLNKPMPLNDKGEELLKFALNAGGTDNITLQLIRISNSLYGKSNFVSLSPARAEVTKTNPDLKKTQDLDQNNSNVNKTNTTLNDIPDKENNNTDTEKDENEQKKKLLMYGGAGSAIVILLLILWLSGVFSFDSYKMSIECNGFKKEIEGEFSNKEEVLKAAEKYFESDVENKDNCKIVIKKNGKKAFEYTPEKTVKNFTEIKVEEYPGKYSTWKEIYDEFKVCPCYIITVTGKNKFAKKDGWYVPKTGMTLTIPHDYSARKDLNPDDYTKFANDVFLVDKCTNITSCNFKSEFKKTEKKVKSKTTSFNTDEEEKENRSENNTGETTTTENPDTNTETTDEPDENKKEPTYNEKLAAATKKLSEAKVTYSKDSSEYEKAKEKTLGNEKIYKNAKKEKQSKLTKLEEKEEKNKLSEAEKTELETIRNILNAAEKNWLDSKQEETKAKTKMNKAKKEMETAKEELAALKEN